jgi:hypothetical protein
VWFLRPFWTVAISLVPYGDSVTGLSSVYIVSVLADRPGTQQQQQGTKIIIILIVIIIIIIIIRVQTDMVFTKK